ncbi:hypothetical protein [Actinopolyspora mortivallis]|uniref:hypothetical protein n=1 Tax=Actinopolyspora mortivallis TaxID=33906 RepID=UPI00035C2F44|nr:hypothetical protein [Actinopolyspora mortivallis]
MDESEGYDGDGSAPDEAEDPGFSEVLRRQSAGWRLLAERMHPRQQPALDELDKLGLDSESLRATFDQFRQQALLLHNAMSAQARAYDEMMEAGGPDDPEAYENYRLATEFITDLMPW